LRRLQRNRQPIWYSNYASTTTLYDEYGNENGTKVNYTNPVKADWNVGTVDSDAEAQMFGVKAVDTIKVIADKSGFPLSEASILWWGVTPIIKTDGSTDTKHNYAMAGIRPSLNELVFYATKVDVS